MSNAAALEPASDEPAIGGGDPHPRIANVAPTVRRVAADGVLFRQGDASFGLFRLVSGRIRLLRTTPAGAQVAMHTVRPGELFAEASLFSPRYHCDAVATRDSDVLIYPKAEVVQRLKGEPAALWAFAAEMALRVHDLRTRLEIRQIRSASDRVLQSLRLRCGASDSWKIDGTLMQFAEEIGLTHEALYRALAGLERDGRIVRGDGEIRLLAHPEKRVEKELSR